MWGEPLDTCMMDVRFREKFEDALAIVISDEERAGLDILTHGDLHCDDDMAGRSLAPLSAAALGRVRRRLAAVGGDALAVAALSAGHAAERDLHRLALAARRRHDRAPPARLPEDLAPGAGQARKPVRFGTCCSQVMGLFLDIHTPKYTDQRAGDLGHGRGHEHGAAARCATPAAGCIQIEEPTLHFLANTYGEDHDEVKFMIEAFNREVQGSTTWSSGSTRAGATRTCSG